MEKEYIANIKCIYNLYDFLYDIKIINTKKNEIYSLLIFLSILGAY